MKYIKVEIRTIGYRHMIVRKIKKTKGMFVMWRGTNGTPKVAMGDEMQANQIEMIIVKTVLWKDQE